MIQPKMDAQEARYFISAFVMNTDPSQFPKPTAPRKIEFFDIPDHRAISIAERIHFILTEHFESCEVAK